VRHFHYNEVFSTFRAGVVILRVQKNLQKLGVELPGEDPILDNLCTRRLADLLGLPPPGTSRVVPSRSVSGTVQLSLTGPGGGDWVVVSEAGRTTRRAGRAEAPDATVVVPAADWAAIRRGEVNPFNAWTSGRLRVTGDATLYQQLAAAIARTWGDDATPKEDRQ
jgi:putative sterol carrier protein